MLIRGAGKRASPCPACIAGFFELSDIGGTGPELGGGVSGARTHRLAPLHGANLCISARLPSDQPTGTSVISPVPIRSADGFGLFAIALPKKFCHSESVSIFVCNSP